MNIDLLSAPESTLPLAERVAAELGLSTQHSRLFLEVAFENAKLFDKKQNDYGPRNILAFGTFGIVVRMNDKFERLKSLLVPKSKRKKPQNESIMDTYRDIANYASIAIMVETNRWPEK